MLAQLMGSGAGKLPPWWCATTAAYCLAPVVSESVWRRRESGAAPANDPTKTPLTEYTLQCEYSQLTGIERCWGSVTAKLSTVIIRHSFAAGGASGGESG